MHSDIVLTANCDIRNSDPQMISSSSIPYYEEIAQLYAAAGVTSAPRLPSIDVISLDAAPQAAAKGKQLGAHRRGFFQLTYLASHDEGPDVIVGSSPGQVLEGFEYLRPTFEGQQGYTVLFKSEVVSHQLASPSNEFPYFHLPASLELPVPADTQLKLFPQFQSLENAVRRDGAYRLQRASALLAALLYDVRWIYEQVEAQEIGHRLCPRLVCRFDEIVLQHFHTHHTVEDFARLLNVSPDHLSAEVKAKTGRNAREFIAERLITEAKHLLTYTELSVSQISDQLGFSEPTHFTRFFKRNVEASPLQFRQRTQALTTLDVNAPSTEARKLRAM